MEAAPADKNCLGKNDSALPNVDGHSENILITAKHPIHINGKEVIIEKLINNDTIKPIVLDQPANIYSIQTETRMPIDMSGLGVYTWGVEDWNAFTKSHMVFFGQQ